MTGQELKALANSALDEIAKRELGRPLSPGERMRWWCSPQGGVDEPYLLTIGGTDEQRQAALDAARAWKP